MVAIRLVVRGGGMDGRVEGCRCEVGGAEGVRGDLGFCCGGEKVAADAFAVGSGWAEEEASRLRVLPLRRGFAWPTLRFC